jgi:hypothetical protein
MELEPGKREKRIRLIQSILYNKTLSSPERLNIFEAYKSYFFEAEPITSKLLTNEQGFCLLGSTKAPD